MSITIEGLEKVYDAGRKAGSVHALKPLQLTVNEGEVFGLLGPNGAGKTTLIKLLLGIVFPTSGTAHIFDRKIGTVSSKELVGYLPENHRYPQYLTGGRVLEYFGQLSGVEATALRSRCEELLELVNMKEWKDMKVKKYSKGMMQRIGIAQALINDPKVVFLDEPTDGVDPVGRKEIRGLIAGLRRQGKTVFLNSHLLSEVEMICDRVAILNHGELVRMGTVEELTQSGKIYHIETLPEHTTAFASVITGFSPKRVDGHEAMIEFTGTEQLNNCIDALRAQNIPIAAVSPAKQTLEELFINVITEGGAE